MPVFYRLKTKVKYKLLRFKEIEIGKTCIFQYKRWYKDYPYSAHLISNPSVIRPFSDNPIVAIPVLY